METDKESLLRWLGHGIRPRLEIAALALRSQFETPAIRIFEGPVGSLTEYQGHDVGIEAVWPDGDNVALTVGLARLTSEPRVLADVVWGHPHGACEACSRESALTVSDWPTADPENLADIEANLDDFIEAFRTAIARGGPPR